MKFIGSKKIENNIVKKITKSTLKQHQLSRANRLKKHKIFREVNCSCAYVIYLIKCTLCKKQYVRKTEILFNVRLNNHGNDVTNPHPKTILACKYFWEKNHNFNKHAKFIIVEKLTNTKKLKKLKATLNPKIQTLDTMYSKGLNQELSK